MFHRSLSTRKIVERGLFELRRKPSVGTLIRHHCTNQGRAFTKRGRLVFGTTAVVGIGALGSWWYGIGPLAAVPTPLAGSEKRKDYITWEEWYMGVAILAAQRSKDPATQVGAVVVDKHGRIAGIGWNGMPTGTSDDKMSWGKGNPDKLRNKDLYVVHAEENALANKTSVDVRGCKMYVTLFPCSHCAKQIIQHGIEEVIYLSDKKKDKDEFKAARVMFEAKGTPLRRYTANPNRPKIELDFSYMGPE